MTRPFKTTYTLEDVTTKLEDLIKARDEAYRVADGNLVALYEEQIDAIVKFCETKSFKKKWGIK
jgi:hypothetical protein